jgi:hypothetical protein
MISRTAYQDVKSSESSFRAPSHIEPDVVSLCSPRLDWRALSGLVSPFPFRSHLPSAGLIPEQSPKLSFVRSTWIYRASDIGGYVADAKLAVAPAQPTTSSRSPACNCSGRADTSFSRACDSG